MRKKRNRAYREKDQLFLTAYAHLDTQWRWDYRATIELFLKQTLEENFRLFEQYPAYRFNFTGALRYMLIEEYYPDLFQQLRHYIQRNRWYTAGSSLDETDAVVPSCESMIRNILYGNLYFKRTFGKQSYDYMLPDSFGFPENMPTLLTHCGITGFSTQKLSWRSINGIPFAIGNWIGPDGSQLTAALDPGRYSSSIRCLPISVIRWRNRLRTHRKTFSVPKDYRYYGSGDIGGAPSEKSVKLVDKLVRKRDPFIRQESADRFFTSLTKRERQLLPRFNGDLLLTRHSAGSLTSQAIMKRWNSQLERAAFTAEAAAVMANWINGTKYPGEKLAKAWQLLIGNQMHDILPGTSTPKAYTFAYNNAVTAMHYFQTVLEDAAESIAQRMPLLKEAVTADSNQNVPYKTQDLLLFNPVPTTRTAIVNSIVDNVDFSSRLKIKETDGSEIPIQILDQRGNRANVLMAVKMESSSWKLLRTHEGLESRKASIEFPATAKNTITGIQMENRLYRIAISNDGVVTSIYLKPQGDNPGKEFLEAPLFYSLQKERPFLFPAWNMDWKDRRKRYNIVSQETARILINEQGPLRASVSIDFPLGKSSRITKHISLHAVGCEELIHIHEHISWSEKGVSLKVGFPLTVKNPDTASNWETSRTRHSVNTRDQYEFPSRFWIDHTDVSKNYGFSIISPDKYGYDIPEDDLLRHTLLYTPGRSPFTYTFRDQFSQDWGEHHIYYALYPHRRTHIEAGTEQLSEQFRLPIRAFHPKLRKNTIQPDKLLPAAISFFTLSTSQVSVIACKMEESVDVSDSYIIRVKENWGLPLKQAEIVFTSRILEAFMVDGQEQYAGGCDWNGMGILFDLPRNGLTAFRVRLASANGKKSARPMAFHYMDFPRNTQIISTNGDAAAASGPLFPQETMPQTIHNGPIPFRIENSDTYNVLACGGELLTVPDILPGVRADTIYILAAADSETDAVFRFPEAPDKEIVVKIPAMSGFIGQYDTRVWEHPPREPRDYIWKNRCLRIDPGFMKRERLEWHASHMHGGGADFPCYFGYLYRIRIDLPDEVGSIQLPRDARVKIFSMTASEDNLFIHSASPISDKFDFR